MDKISELIITMINKNVTTLSIKSNHIKKINSKNAFDVPMPNVQKMNEF